MNKNTIILIVVLILLVIAGIGYSFIGKSNTNPQTKTKTLEEKKQSTSEVVKGTIQSLFNAGKSVTCSVNYQEEQFGKGTIYVSGEKMRGDFDSTIEGQKMISHVIYDGNYSYIWSDQEKTGIKMKIDKDLLSPTPGNSETLDLDEEVDMKCSAWTTDISKFVPPTDVKFTDFSSMLNGNQQQTNTQEKTGSPCDSITDANAKSVCLDAIKSNPQQ